jgi:ankyrin repeat protein
MHLAAAEGCFSVAKWLLESGAAHSPLDRFKRTPLEEAVRGSHRELISMLLEQGAQVIGLDGTLGDLSRSAFAGGVAMTAGR